MATAIANTEAHAQVERLAEEQAALRRVATLVAKESPAEVFAKVAEELANVLGDVDCSLFRDEGDGTASVVALWGAGVSASMNRNPPTSRRRWRHRVRTPRTAAMPDR